MYANHPRIGNEAFTSYAWRCNSLTTSDTLTELLPENSPVIQLAQKLDKMEKVVYTLGDRRPFALFVASMNRHNLGAETRGVQKSATSKVLQSYRVVDVFAKTDRSNQGDSMHAYLSPCARIDPGQTLNDISKWARDVTQYINVDLLSNQCVLSAPSDTKLSGIYLLNQMAHCQAKRASLSMLTNVLACALNLQILMRGVFHVPTKIKDCVDLTGATADDIKKLSDLQNTLFPKGNEAKLEKPLVVALACSPIVIAGGRRCLYKGAGSWIMEAWNEIEPTRKSKAVLEAERVMWNFLIDLALSLNVAQSLQQLVTALVPLTSCAKETWILPEEMRCADGLAAALASSLNGSSKLRAVEDLSGERLQTVSPAQLSISSSTTGSQAPTPAFSQDLDNVGADSNSNGIDATHGGDIWESSSDTGSSTSEPRRITVVEGSNDQSLYNEGNGEQTERETPQEPLLQDEHVLDPDEEGANAKGASEDTASSETELSEDASKKRKGKPLRDPTRKKKQAKKETVDKDHDDIHPPLEISVGLTQVKSGSACNFYSSRLRNRIFNWTPVFMTQRDLHAFDRLMDASGQCTTSDAIEQSSAVESMTAELYKNMSVTALQRTLREKHVLVRKETTSVMEKMNWSTVRQLGSLEARITVVDFSTPVDNRHALRSTTLVELITHLDHNAPTPMRVLPIGLMYDPFQSVPGQCQPYASEQWAWEEVEGNMFCYWGTPYPMPQMRWGTFASSGATDGWKMNGSGRGTVLRVEKGTVLCFMLIARQGGPSVKDGLLFDCDADEHNEDVYDVELIALRTGDLMIMRPNQLYKLITAELTVARGANFYVTATLADTVAGLYHEFVCGARISKDEDHETAIAMLTRLITLYHKNLTTTTSSGIGELLFATELGKHSSETVSRNMDHVPEITDWHDFVGVLSVCIFFELYTGLAPWTYEGKTQFILWKRALNNRVLARQLMNWVFQNHSFTPVGGSELTATDARDELYYANIGRTAAALVQYKKKACSVGIKGNTSASYRSAKYALELCIHNSAAWRFYRRAARSTVTNLICNGEPWIIETVEERPDIMVPTKQGATSHDPLLAKRLGLKRDGDNT